MSVLFRLVSTEYEVLISNMRLSYVMNRVHSFTFAFTALINGAWRSWRISLVLDAEGPGRAVTLPRMQCEKNAHDACN